MASRSSLLLLPLLVALFEAPACAALFGKRSVAFGRPVDLRGGGESDPAVPINGNDADERDITFVPEDDVEEDEDDEVEGSYTEAVLDTDVLKEGEPVTEAGQEEEYFHDALQEEDGEEEVLPQRLLDRLEEAADHDDGDDTIGRMELADAYDEGETTAGEADVIPDDVTEISSDMERTLIEDLKYSSSDVSVMKPSIAAYVISKGLVKPQEGMPLNFYLPGKEPKPKKALNKVDRRKKVKKIIVSILVAAAGAAVLALASGDSDVSASFTPPEPEPLPAGIEEEILEPEPVAPATPRLMTEEERRAAEDALDVTWLDKGITKVERAIKAFLRIKI